MRLKDFENNEIQSRFTVIIYESHCNDIYLEWFYFHFTESALNDLYSIKEKERKNK